MSSAAQDWGVAVVGPLLVAASVWAFRAARAARADRHRRRTRQEAGWDVILGKAAEVDPLSGKELRPAVDDIGTRTANLEHLMSEVVVRSVEEAKAAAKAAAASAASAEQSAAAAHAIAVGLQQQVTTWQGVDRKQAETLRSVVHELGMDVDIPHQPKEAGQ